MIGIRRIIPLPSDRLANPEIGSCKPVNRLPTTRAQVAFTSIPLVGTNNKLAEYSGHERHHRKNLD